VAANITSFTLDMTAGLVSIAMDAAVTLPATVPANSMYLQNASTSPAAVFDLVGSTIYQASSTTGSITISYEAFTRIASQSTYLTNRNNSYLRVTSSFPTNAVTLQAETYTGDINAPQLVNFAYDASSTAPWNILLSTTEPWLNVQLNQITLQSSGSSPTYSYTLTGGTTWLSAGLTYIKFSSADAAAIAAISGLCTALNNTFLTFPTGVATSWVGVPQADVNGKQADVYISASGSTAPGFKLASTPDLQIQGGNTGQVLTAVGNTGQMTWASPSAGVGNFLITSNINSLTAGYQIRVGYANNNANYPGGVWTIFQTPPPSTSMTDYWLSSISTTKDAYSTYDGNTANSVVIQSNVSMTIGVTGDTFAIDTGNDYILIGSSNITGTDLGNLSITGTGGTYTINKNLISNTTFTTSTVSVSGRLTTAINGQLNFTGSTLYNTAPVPFSIGSVSGAFAQSSVPYWSKNQTFNWTVGGVSGTVDTTANTSTVKLSGTNTANLTTIGATSGTSSSYDSTTGTFTLTANFSGTGTHGYTGTNTSTATGSVSTATAYYPLFYKITTSNANPSFANTDSHLTANFALGQGATTNSTTTDYLWMAIPATIYSAQPTFKFDAPPFLGVVAPPDQIYANQTISGQTYNVYGFTDFQAATLIYTA
jgi:hypothetical protein